MRALAGRSLAISPVLDEACVQLAFFSLLRHHLLVFFKTTTTFQMSPFAGDKRRRHSPCLVFVFSRRSPLPLSL